MVTEPVTDDAYIVASPSSLQDTNYGDDYVVIIQRDTSALTFGLIQTSSLERKPIKNARLHFYVTYVEHSDNDDLEFYAVLNQIDEDTVTWNNAPSSTQPVTSIPSVSENAWNDVGVTDQLNRTVRKGFGCLYIKKLSSSYTYDNINIESSEEPNAPYFEVTYGALDEILVKQSYVYTVGETLDEWGQIYIQSIDNINEEALLDITTPWGTTYNNVVLESHETSKTYIRDIGDGTYEKYIVKVEGGIVNNNIQFEEYWWFSSNEGDDKYLSTTGSDSNGGTASWEDAWASLLYASHYLYDGDTLHVEYGEYTEDVGVDGIQFPNVGSNGIDIIPENTDGTQTQGSEAKFTLV
jgi:hypothetical protein